MTRYLTVPLGLLLLAPLSFIQPGLAQAPAPTPTPTTAPSPTPVPGTPPVPKTDTPGPAAPSTVPTAQPSPSPTPSPTPKNIDDTVKGYDKTPGLWTIYRKVEKNKQQFYAELTEEQLKQSYMLQSTFDSGNASRVVAGRPARDLVFSWKQTPDDRLILTTSNPWYRAKDPNLKTAVERDFPQAFLAGFPIVARQAERKSVLIDLGPILDGSVTGLGQALEGVPGGPSSYALDQSLSFVDSFKSFPGNLVAEVQYHFKSSGRSGGSDTQADPRSLPIRLVYNLYALPQDTNVPNGYRPRRADPRVGYFVNGMLSAGRTGYESFDDDASSDPRVIYINRWRLEKANPAAKLSPPVKPITFIVDTSVPAAYRPTVKNALLSWNKAFERIGFQNAIVVKDPPKDSDYDHADMRFNVIRWVASPPTDGSAYAVALMRENPFTGEIINAGINVDANFARVAFREKFDIINPLDDVRKQTPAYAEQGGVACEMDGEMHRQMMLGYEALQATGTPLDTSRYVNTYLRQIVAHEFGHILGLRHNFLASTYHSPQALANPATVRKSGYTASLMDYTSFNVFGLKTGADLFLPGPGVYDQWAIEYGYSQLPVGKEASALKAIAARSTEPGHAYQTDDTADGYDPSVVRYDLSSDPLAYAEDLSKLAKYLLKTLPQRAPRPGESYAIFTNRFRGLLANQQRSAGLALRYVGGVRTRRVVRGGGSREMPFQPVSAAEGKRALGIIAQTILAPDAFQVPEDYFRKTSVDLYDPDYPAVSTAFPIRDDIVRYRLAVLNSLFQPARLSRIANLEYKFPEPGATLRLIELFPAVRQSIWSGIGPKTVLSAGQRDLQKAHLQILIAYALKQYTGAPADARAIAESELRQIRSQIAGPRNTSPDAYTRLHFADVTRRIESALREKVF